MTSHSLYIRNAGKCLALVGLGFCAIAHAYAPNDIVVRYAGNYQTGYSGDGGPAVAASLTSPNMMALDAGGNLYISDVGNSTIRKVSTVGLITTIAGTGTAGYNGDAIAATAAQLSSPRGLAVDASGNLYIADTGNQRIRKITFATGLISTVAGSGANGCSNDTPAAAIFSAPVGLAFDSAGVLYISEAGNRIVRKLAGGFVSSFAGSCSQPVFGLPLGITSDASGNIYVADRGANQVLKYDSNGNRTLFAGGEPSGPNSGDGNPATAAGVTLSNPTSMAFDAAGNAFIGSGSEVRVVTLDGIIHTATGNAMAGHSGDGGLATNAQFSSVAGVAVNAAGRLLVSDSDSTYPAIRIIGPAAPVTVAVAGDGIAATGDGIASADGRISCPGICGGNYVNGMAVIFDATPASPDPLYQWTGAACSGNAACTLTPRTTLPTSITGRFTPWYIKTLLGGSVGPTLQGPFALTFDAGGNLYFTETTDCVVRKRSTNGTLTTVAGNGVCGNLGDGIPATQAELNNPQGVVVDAAGNIYIQDTGNGVIRKVTADGLLHTFATGIFTGSNSPALIFNSAGDLFAIDSSDTIVRINSDGATQPFASIPALTPLSGLGSSVKGGNIVAYGAYVQTSEISPAFVNLSAQGDVYDAGYFEFEEFVPAGFLVDRRGVQYNELGTCDITAIQNHRVDSVTAPSCAYSGDGGPANSASLNHAVGLALDPEGYLYVADYGNDAIRELYPDAIFTGNMDQ